MYNEILREKWRKKSLYKTLRLSETMKIYYVISFYVITNTLDNNNRDISILIEANLLCKDYNYL